MPNKLYEEASVQAIADAIRAKNGTTTKYKIGEMSAAIQAITGAESVTWHQCPEAVRNYLANVTYDPSDYSTSQIANYAPASAVVSNYKPIGKTVGGVTYYNEVPNVLTPFAGGGSAGTLKPLDTLRWIRTQDGASKAWNVRDLGGWTCDGGKVRYGLLFRGGYPEAADRRVLVGELGIRHDLDLRGKKEAAISVSPLGDDVYYTCADDCALYTLTPEDTWRVNLRCVFDAVTHGEPVYFHCIYGADRTGTLACVLEGLLGMSQSDIDKDYELTCFYTGTATDSEARRRNEAEWSGLIAKINAKSGASFRDKCVTFAAELGFTAAEINAFRAAMIDGTPETVTPSISTFTVTSSITGASSDNGGTSAVQYQPYLADIVALNGRVINSVSVKMGGVDITPEVWSGEETNRYCHVAAQLTNCSSDNAQTLVIEGQSYGANITADADYTLEGATVHITMGGTDVSKYYSGGKIAIPKVTGNINITITAVESAHIAPNILTDSFTVDGVQYQPIGYEDNMRLSVNSGSTKAQEGAVTTGYFPAKTGMVLRIRPAALPDGSQQKLTYTFALYNKNKDFSSATYINSAFTWGTAVLENGDTLKITVTKQMNGYARICIEGSGASTYMTYNDEMPQAGA